MTLQKLLFTYRDVMRTFLVGKLEFRLGAGVRHPALTPGVAVPGATDERDTQLQHK